MIRIFVFTVVCILIVNSQISEECYNKKGLNYDKDKYDHCKINEELYKKYSGGIFKGRDTALPLIEHEFIEVIEGNCPYTYIPFDEKCNVNDFRGLTIGIGIDHNLIDKEKYNCKKTIELLENSKIGNDLINFCINNPEDCLVSSSEDLKACNEKYMQIQLDELEMRYNRSREDGLGFRDINRATRTVIFSVYHHYGNTKRFRNFWYSVTMGNWLNAVTELMSWSFYKGDRFIERRTFEANTLYRAQFDICENVNAQIKVLFIVDASGSITLNQYEKGRQFIAKLAEGWDMGVDKIEAAIIYYGTKVVVATGFTSDKANFIKIAKTLPYPETYTATGDAIRRGTKLLREKN